MPAEQLKNAILYFDYNRLFFYGSNVSDRVIPLNIPATSFRELEVINEEEFVNLIKTFTQYHKILPSSVVLILSETVCFDTKIPVSADKNFNPADATAYFLDLVPFENIISRTFIWEKETTIVATNKNICDLIKNSLESNKFTLENIIPSFVLGPEIQLKNGLDLPTAQNIMGKLEQTKQYNLLKNQNITPSTPTKTAVNLNPEHKDDNKTLIYLLPALVLLIIIFVILLSKMNQSPNPKKPARNTSYIFQSRL